MFIKTHELLCNQSWNILFSSVDVSPVSILVDVWMCVLTCACASATIIILYNVGELILNQASQSQLEELVLFQFSTNISKVRFCFRCLRIPQCQCEQCQQRIVNNDNMLPKNFYRRVLCGHIFFSYRVLFLILQPDSEHCLLSNLL